MRWYALWQAFLAGYLTLIAAGVWSDLLGMRGAGIMVAIGAALNAGTAAYYAATSKIVAPTEAVDMRRVL